MKKFLLLLFLSTTLFAENRLQLLEEVKERMFWCFEDRQEIIEAEATLLYLTSTISSPFSNELLLLNSALFSEFTDILSLKTASVSPEYNAGFQTELRYHIPTSNHLLIGSYRYIHNDADGRVKRNNITNSPDGLVQQNIQNDHGNQHVHLHTADLLLRHVYSVTKTAIFYISAGLSFNDIHFHFNFHNNDHILNSNIPNPLVTPTSTQLDLSSYRKIRIWGLGPKLGFGFDILTFWEIYDLNREINYRMEKSQPVLAAQLREEDSVGFSGPYFSISLSY